MALVVAIGKHSGAQSFGDPGNKFQAAVLGAGARYQQIHVVFDRYSIKAGARERRSRTTRPIRRAIDNPNAPLPSNGSNFLALPDN